MSAEQNIDFVKDLYAAFARGDLPYFAAAGEYVYATVDQSYKVRRTGATLPMKDGVHHFKIKGGRVVAWFAAEDTQLTNEALG